MDEWNERKDGSQLIDLLPFVLVDTYLVCVADLVRLAFGTTIHEGKRSPPGDLVHQSVRNEYEYWMNNQSKSIVTTDVGARMQRRGGPEGLFPPPLPSPLCMRMKYVL